MSVKKRSLSLTAISALLVILVGITLPPVGATTVPYPGMVITTDVTFTPGTYNFSSGQGITIAAHNISVDGNGAVLVGLGTAGNPASFVGTAVTADGYNGVTLRNLTARGFLLGLYVKNATNWNITNNNFSDNYTDPNYGWGDNHVIHNGYAPAGAICLDHVTYSTIAGNTGNNVWDGLYMYYSDHNTVNGNNHFSPCSNVCLKMWHSSYNIIDGNVMSYGIRCDPGEVHARDSTSALIETGSDYNQILNNDFTHGGDGLFIRVLNSWVSKGNYFYNNDVSYAHNNGFESWSPDNTFEHNTANYCSYGFWLGGSDHTVLIDNEAAYNGTVNANAPEADFGNAGVAVVGGSSSHFICERNNIHDNGDGSHAVSGLAIRYTATYPAFHWILQKNTITNNTRYGLFYKDTKWIEMAANTISGNSVADTYNGGNVTDIFTRTALMTDLVPNAVATVSASTVYIGTAVTFDASGSTDPNTPPLPLYYRWDLGDGTIALAAQVTHTYTTAGFKRVGVTVDNGKTADLAWCDVYVVDPNTEYGTEDSAANWAYRLDVPATLNITNDTETKIEGARSIKVDTTSGFGTYWYYPAAMNAHWNLNSYNQLSFWMKSLNQNNGGFQEHSPTVRLYSDASNYYQYASPDLLNGALYSEGRDGWKYFQVPFAGDANWTKTVVGSPNLGDINYIEFKADTWGGGFIVWTDSVGFSSTGAPPTMLSYFDNFNDGNADSWTTYGGTWAVESGEYSVATGYGDKSVANNTYFTDLVYEADVKLVSSTTGNAGVIFRVSNPGVGYDAYQGYYAGLDVGQDVVMLGKANGSGWTEIARYSMTVNADTIYHLKVATVGSSIKVYVTDMAAPKITAADASYTGGAVGVRTWAAHGHFDNIKAYVPVFYDGFESNNFTAGGWTNSGCTLGTTYKYAGTYSAIFNSSDSLTKLQSTVGYTNVTVHYARYTRQCETDDHFIAEWYDGSTWTTLEDLTGNGAWAEKVWNLPAGAANNANFMLRFRTSHNGSSDYAHLDEVRITGTPM